MTEATTRYPFPPHDANAIADALADDTNCLVLIVDVEGAIRWVNQAVATACGMPRDALLNAPITSIFPHAYAQERLRYIREAASTGRPVACEGLTWGLFRLTTFRPLKSRAPDDTGPAQVLVVCRPKPADETSGPPQSGYTIRRAENDDLGPLAILTDRELELLDLVGRGLSNAQIADYLSRSAKTVEFHRVSLGEKLNATNRVELARIALNAGLSGGSLLSRSPSESPDASPAIEPKPHATQPTLPPPE